MERQPETWSRDSCFNEAAIRGSRKFTRGSASPPWLPGFNEAAIRGSRKLGKSWRCRWRRAASMRPRSEDRGNMMTRVDVAWLVTRFNEAAIRGSRKWRDWRHRGADWPGFNEAAIRGSRKYVHDAVTGKHDDRLQ